MHGRSFAVLAEFITIQYIDSISPRWVVMFLDYHRTVFKFLIWLDLLDVVLMFWISILKIFKSHPNYWHAVTKITSFEEAFIQALSFMKVCEISIQEYVS